MAAQTNKLVRFTYAPRVVVYLGVMLAVAASSVLEPGQRYALIALALLFPHLVYFSCLRFFNHASGARYAMMVDAVVVGILIVAMKFDLLASLSFLVCLITGTLLIAPPIVLAGCLVIVSLICGVSLSFHQVIAPGEVGNLFSAIPLMSFSGIAAYLCFRYTTGLVEGHREVGAENTVLLRRSSRLQPYISQHVFRTIADDNAVASQRRHLTVFFSDIEGFTHVMDRLSENTITGLLNEYLDEMAQIAHDFGGTVDKFMGDGVMVFFGDQQLSGAKQDALACVRMALAMRHKLHEIAQGWRRYGPELHIRIGIHSGFCTVGNFGSAERMDYTAVGSAVNRASRLEGCAASDEILISGATHRLIHPEIRCRARAPVTVKGIAHAIPVYTVCELQHIPERVSAVRLLT